ncbi:AAA family ATPase [Ornithinibacillus massiliensis]|uniref:AAA family ATPase n=1 Tax=Ornithinibacillus massiliensis TaxID=1944633 RepID=A0ABS5MDF7_9BACI|nr:AAA family ATPase [Ornithinibacillus massiliensis]MBS3680364.1 AAA family ATPase [Ornithinibacillus massiliensis]
MKKIRIVITDTNVDYLQSLASFIRNEGGNNQFLVTYFSKEETLSSYLKQGEMVDILLVSSEISIPRIQRDMFVILLEDDLLKVKNTSMPSVYRYQRLDQLVSNILGLYYEKNEEAGRLLQRNNQTKIFSFYSPNGGVGKTTTAVNFSKQLALNDAKVFYLNLETFNTTKLFLSDDNENPSLQIFYYAKTASGQLLSKIEKLRRHDPHAMVDFFDIEINAQELLELSGNEIERIVNGLLETDAYDYIILDLDSSIHERNLMAMKESDTIFWILANDSVGPLKTKSFLEEEEKFFGRENVMKDKMSLIINKFNGNLLNDFDELELPIDGYLPFIPNWTHPQSRAELLGNDLFNQEIQSIIRKVILTNQEGGVLNSGF